MRTLEIAFLDPKAGGGAIRASKIIALRRLTGVEDCRTIPIIPQLDDIRIPANVLESCPPIGLAFLPALIQRTPLPERWKLLIASSRSMYKLFNRSYNPDVVISHHDTLESLKIASHIGRSLGSKSVAILQLPQFYGDKSRFIKIQQSIDIYLALIASSLDKITLQDLMYYSYMKHVVPVTRKFVWNVSKNLLRSFDLLLATSPSIPLEMGDEWASRVISFQGYGLDQGEIEYLLELRSLQTEFSKPYLVFPARWAVTKGLADLILASLIVKRSIPSFKLFMVGSSNKLIRSQIERLVHRLGLKDNVVLLGYMRRDEDYWYLRRKAKLTIYPSHEDSFSYTVLESLLLGVPVVAYNIPALRLNYGDVEGLYLVEEGNIEALATKVIEILGKRKVEVEIPPVRTNYDVVLEEKTLIEKLL
jgi:glycosyltransferase involved in cell wall biosynthesis